MGVSFEVRWWRVLLNLAFTVAVVLGLLWWAPPAGCTARAVLARTGGCGGADTFVVLVCYVVIARCLLMLGDLCADALRRRRG